MNLYTLNLHKAISVPAARADTWPKLLQHAEQAAEGFEALAAWSPETILSTGDDGPKCLKEPDQPIICGVTATEESLTENSDSCTLPAGRYMFSQTSFTETESLSDCIEWFARECWWQQTATEGKIWLRLLREDGKTAIQVLQSCKPETP
ncbi:MAG: hypothetical protein KKI09_13445 [Spirochaetes bacterium]|nr:hypothetical protein [Spirochaetota bacterium]